MPRAAHFAATVKEGRLVWSDPGRAAGFLARCQGKRLKVSIELDVPRRTIPQNGLLWVTYTKAAAQIKDQMYKDGCDALAEYGGHTKEEVHEGMKQLYCPEKPVTLPGGRVVMVKSTRLLDKQEMSTYQERCMADFAQHGIQIEVA